DQESVVTKVEFLIDGTVIGEDTESPYEYTWIADQLGTKQISARAYDDNGASETSSSVIINVSPGVGFSVMNNKNFSIKTYPNPASEHLILELSGTDGVDKVIYSLMNIYGQQLTYSCIENPDTLIKEKIDLTAYQQGIYVLRVWTNDKYNQENMINSIIIVER
ncbi:MAG: Ig-like domain-containing protein, partial [Bacteroidales bacterium]